ncbi:MAG: high-affinity iron transporter [Solirubrobacteraceae bacterium]|jgi:high-affinity iron transporter|nr:high-affinity iron transporter [Solirubrobacteraceae bacterium]
MTRRLLSLLLLTIGVAVLAQATPALAVTGQGSVSRDTAIKQLRAASVSIDQSLALMKAGRREQAFEISKSGYLKHFELVEIPLRAANAGLTLKAEEKFAEIRAGMRTGASTSDVRASVIELRGLVTDAERQLTSKGIAAPSVVFGQSFIIMLREGLEAVLLLAILFGYLESTKNGQYRKHILCGVGAAAVATVASIFLIDQLFSVLPFGREVLEAITALLAVVVLFYVSFWLIARLEQRRWLEFLKARIWTAVSAGSAVSLVLIGFTSVYREGFESVLFYQALNTFGQGLGIWIAAGAAAGAAVLAVLATLIFKYGRKLPIKVFLTTAVCFVMATSVAFLGNAISALQVADVLSFTRLDSWPHLPIFLAQATGYSPTQETVIAQALLAAVYIGGAIWVFGIRPLRQRSATPAKPAKAAAPTPATAEMKSS